MSKNEHDVPNELFPCLECGKPPLVVLDARFDRPRRTIRCCHMLAESADEWNAAIRKIQGRTAERLGGVAMDDFPSDPVERLAFQAGFISFYNAAIRAVSGCDANEVEADHGPAGRLP